MRWRLSPVTASLYSPPALLQVKERSLSVTGSQGRREKIWSYFFLRKVVFEEIQASAKVERFLMTQQLVVHPHYLFVTKKCQFASMKLLLQSWCVVQLQVTGLSGFLTPSVGSIHVTPVELETILDVYWYLAK
jgi:hypothetical protein